MASQLQVLLFLLGFIHLATAQIPRRLERTLLPQGTVAQEYADQGHSVAIDRGIAAVGIPFADVGRPRGGVVQIYDVSNGALLRTLTNPVLGDDLFGKAVAICGTHVAVVAGRVTSSVVHIFDLEAGNPGVPVTTLLPPTADHKWTGVAVAVDGSRVVVGSEEDEEVYVFEPAGPNPQVPTITLRNQLAVGQGFGHAVAIDGERLIVGAPYRTDFPQGVGQAYAFDLANPTAQPLIFYYPEYYASPPHYNANFGHSVAISGKWVVIGAPDLGFVSIGPGRAYAYDLTGAKPTEPVKKFSNPAPTNGDYFGYSVGVADTWVVIGAFGESVDGNGAGIAYVYNLASPTAETAALAIRNPSPRPGDSFWMVHKPFWVTGGHWSKWRRHLRHGRRRCLCIRPRQGNTGYSRCRAKSAESRRRR